MAKEMLIRGLWISIPFRQAKVRDVLPPARGEERHRSADRACAGQDAGFYCDRIERLPAVSDHRTLSLLEPYVTALDSTKPFQMKHLTSRFILVMPDDADCRVAHCYYRLLEVKDGEVRERFGFRGTGVIWNCSTPAEVRIEDFQDYFSNYGLETSAGRHIGLFLPRTAQEVL